MKPTIIIAMKNIKPTKTMIIVRITLFCVAAIVLKVFELRQI